MVAGTTFMRSGGHSMDEFFRNLADEREEHGDRIKKLLSLKPKAPTCKECIYYQDNKESEVSRCRRFPPDKDGQFSITDEYKWCGEFNPLGVCITVGDSNA